ncbi:MAG TPA: type 4a pilus biogenesis protein PilO [Vicinamibacterales bacterium]|nr:type 4a pilus biogenesis protein PilO [Vicinamibacterales bacterium]
MALNLSLGTLPWYGQVGAFVALSLALAGAFWQLVAKDTMTAIDDQRQQLATLKVEIDRGLAIARGLPGFRKEVGRLETQLDRLRAVLPEEQDVADLLRRAQAMATQSNLAIRGFTPRMVARKTLHAEWPIGLKLEGTYHDLGAFLERVNRFPRIINVDRIKIKAHDAQAGGATVDAECTATTFVLLDPKAAKAVESAEAPADAGGPASPQRFTYNSEGRRDPFVSPLRRGSDHTATKGPRPSGLPGMGTSEVSLRGTLMGPSGAYVGILQGIDNKSYIVHVGDRLLDGSIRAILADAIVIVQQVHEPLSPEKEREVRKLLRQTEQAN